MSDPHPPRIAGAVHAQEGESGGDEQQAEREQDEADGVERAAGDGSDSGTPKRIAKKTRVTAIAGHEQRERHLLAEARRRREQPLSAPMIAPASSATTSSPAARRVCDRAVRCGGRGRR